MYCVSFDPSNMSPDPDTDKGSIEIQQIHSWYTSTTPHTVNECLHVVDIVYDDTNQVLFVVNWRGLLIYQASFTATLTTNHLCTNADCMEIECASSYDVYLDNVW
jgi:hypothetical protein